MRFVKYSFYLTALVFPFGQLASFALPAYPEVRVHFLDVLVGLTVGTWIALSLLTPGDSFHETPDVFRIAQSILLFVGVGVLSIFVNIGNYELQQLVIGSLYLVRFAAYAGLYFVVRDLRKHSMPGDLRNSTSGDSLRKTPNSTSGDSLRKTPDVLTSVLVTVGLVSAGFGLLQLFLYPNLRNLKYLGWDPHLNRAFGTFLDPQFLGIILVLTLLLVFSRSRFLTSSPRDLLRKTPGVLAIIVFVTLLLTYSRSSYLALGVGLGALGVLGKFRRLGRFWYLGILGSLGVISVLILLLFKPEGVAGDLLRAETAISRIKSWKEAVEIWNEKPILGVGFNMYKYARSHFSTSGDSFRETPDVSHAGAGVDNSFLFVLATTGVVGLLAYLNIWRVLLGKITGTKLAIAAGVFTHALFNNTLFYPWVMWWVWVYFALFNPLASRRR